MKEEFNEKFYNNNDENNDYNGGYNNMGNMSNMVNMNNIANVGQMYDPSVANNEATQELKVIINFLDFGTFIGLRLHPRSTDYFAHLFLFVKKNLLCVLLIKFLLR